MTSILNDIYSRRADISFYHDGRIDITSRIARQLNLADGDVIDICLDCATGEYYLYIRLRADKVVGRHHAVCHPTKSRSNNFRAYSARLCNAIFALAGIQSSAARFPCGLPEPHNDKSVRIPIITRLAL